MTEFIREYWYLLVMAMCMGGVLVQAVHSFAGLSTNEQINSVKEWLLYAVVQAEAEYGGGSGQVKLRYVYDMFAMRFPLLLAVLPFDTFALFVDEALDKAKDSLETVKGEGENE